MSMFPSSLAAVRAAVAIQRELSAQDVLVRIGVHVGEVIVEPERLTGEAVNIAARIESFAVAGGVMLSDSAYDQIKNRSDVGVVRLGRFRLKNVGRPFELFAVSADGIVVPDAEALEGKGERFASLPSNLPDPVSPLIGRADEAGFARRACPRTPRGHHHRPRRSRKDAAPRRARPHALARVPGRRRVRRARRRHRRRAVPRHRRGHAGREGGGGTDARRRHRRADRREEGAPAPRQPRAGRVRRSGHRPVGRALPRATDRDDEQDAAQDRCRTRAPARPARASTDADSDAIESLVAYPAIEFFVDRAKTTRGSFELTRQNAEAVAAICRRLDGLPLALELAAARLRILSPESLLERLDHALQLLTSGPRDRPRAAADAARDDRLEPLAADATRSSASSGAWPSSPAGAPSSDAEAVCGDAGEAILDELESLVDKALVQMDGQDDRLRMLQTIGEYANDRLDDAGERAEIALRHARRYAELAREIRDGIEGTDLLGSVERGIAEEGNLQAALDTLLADGPGRRRPSVRGGSAVVRRPLLLLAHPRQEPDRARVRGSVHRGRQWRDADAGAGGCADHGGPRLVDPRPVRAGGRGVGRGVPHRVGARRRPRALRQRVLPRPLAARERRRGGAPLDGGEH